MTRIDGAAETCEHAADVREQFAALIDDLEAAQARLGNAKWRYLSKCDEYNAAAREVSEAEKGVQNAKDAIAALTDEVSRG